jgi:hypothetical protein
MTLVSPIYHSRQKKTKRTAAEIFQLKGNRHPSRSERLAWRVVKPLGFQRNQILFGYPVSFIHRLKKLIIEIGEPTRLPMEYGWRDAGYKILWFAWDSNYQFQIPVALNWEGLFGKRHKGNAGYGNTVQKSVRPSQPQYATRVPTANVGDQDGIHR